MTNVEIVEAPTDLTAPSAMQEAVEGLLDRFNPEEPPQADRIQSVIENEKSALIFALLHESREIDWQSISTEQYVGMLTLVGLETTTRLSGHIEHVVVDSRHEGKKIGERLVCKALEIGSARGFDRFDLTSNASKEPAQRLYAKTGFFRRNTVNWRFEV